MTRSLISLLALSAAVVLFFMYTKPAYDGLAVTKAQIIEYDRALENANKLQQLKQTLLSRFNAFDPAQLKKLEKLLPDHVDNVRLVLDLDNLASRHELTLENLLISGPSKVDSSQISADTIQAGGTEFDSLTLGFSTTGTYKEFVVFLTDLEKSLRIVDVEQLKISASTAEGAGEPLYRFEITLRTYWLK